MDLKKLKIEFLTQIKNISKKILAIWLLIFFGGNLLFVTYISYEDIANKFSLNAKMKALEVSYKYFTQVATDKEKLVRWIDLYYQREYSQTRRYGTFDCSSSVINYFRSFGSEMVDENVRAIKARILKLEELKLIEIRKFYREIRPWDIIIFKPDFGNYHIALVFGKSKGIIQYTDMNGKVDTMGFGTIEHTSTKIDMVVGISFALWCGDFLMEYE